MEEIKHYHYLSFHLLQRTTANHVVSSPLVSFSTRRKKDLCTQLPQVLCVVIPPPPNIFTYLILFHLKILVDKSVSRLGFRCHTDTCVSNLPSSPLLQVGNSLSASTLASLACNLSFLIETFYVCNEKKHSQFSFSIQDLPSSLLVLWGPYQLQ